jgi:hypothetical protein
MWREMSKSEGMQSRERERSSRERGSRSWFSFDDTNVPGEEVGFEYRQNSSRVARGRGKAGSKVKGVFSECQ